MDVLQEGSEELGISLSSAQIVQFQRYYELLTEWNQRMNLTAIEGYQEVQTKHFLDSIAGAVIVAEELGEALPPTRPLRVVDVGSGAGFPGLPLKIVWPALSMTLLDGTGKKVTFLNEVVSALGLQNVTVVQARAEEIGTQEEYRAQFDLVTARAVARLNTLVEYLLPLARINGFVMAYKGPNAAEEFMQAGQAITKLGGETVRFAPVDIPYLEEERRILLIKKIAATPKAYPRQRGMPRKEPL